VACWAQGCQTDSPAPADDSFARQVSAEVAASHERYRVAAQSFIDAIARGDTAAAYEKLAPSYTNMVSAESFAARIVKNRNFSQPLAVKVFGTSSTAGTTRARCVLGDLGLTEIVFAERQDGPRISALSIAGAPALPPPE